MEKLYFLSIIKYNLSNPTDELFAKEFAFEYEEDVFEKFHREVRAVLDKHLAHLLSDPQKEKEAKKTLFTQGQYSNTDTNQVHIFYKTDGSFLYSDEADGFYCSIRIEQSKIERSQRHKDNESYFFLELEDGSVAVDCWATLTVEGSKDICGHAVYADEILEYLGQNTLLMTVREFDEAQAELWMIDQTEISDMIRSEDFANFIKNKLIKQYPEITKVSLKY